MIALRHQLGLASFLALSGAVLVNVFFLQPNLRAVRLELGPSPEQPLRTAAGPSAPAASLAELSELTKGIQRELELRGYAPGPADGVASLVTRAAIMAYEYDHGLALTAEPSDGLLRAILLDAAEAAPASARCGPHAEQVIRTAQQSLANLGYGPDKIDGLPGQATVRAIRRFERDQGMPESGRISAPLVTRLAQMASRGHVQSPR